jgi:hypothetical protein
MGVEVGTGDGREMMMAGVEIFWAEKIDLAPVAPGHRSRPKTARRLDRGLRQWLKGYSDKKTTRAHVMIMLWPHQYLQSLL